MRIVPAVLLIAAFAVAGCAKKLTEGAPTAPTGEQAKAGAFLAYEHTVRIVSDDADIAPRINAVREACGSERFGTCSLLSESIDSGSRANGEIVVRVVPTGIEPLVNLAAKDGTISARSTHAEDLAQAVADNARERRLLENQRAKLESFQTRKDLSVADMLALARELASLETQMDGAEQIAAQQRRRIETNLLTIRFFSNGDGESRVGVSLRNLWHSFTDGFADAVEYSGYLLPFVLFGFPLLLLLRWLWRRSTRSRSRAEASRSAN